MDSNCTYELLPNAKMLLASLRSVGYTEETAIADIVDNSISSGADIIQLFFDWDEKTIIIVDNGTGMNQTELLDSMKIGSANPLEMRAENDLGRFGMGMKTASFSLGKSLLVISKQNNQLANAEWDLDYVASTNKWEVIIHSDEELKNIQERFNDKLEFCKWNNGTAIILSMLDCIIDDNNLEKSKKRFYKIIKNLKAHLSMIFHRFMEEDEITIFVNGNTLKPWDPFVKQNPATRELSYEEYDDGKELVKIEPYILPHKTKFVSEEEYKEASGIKDWLGHQGFYVYRNRRLIVYGTWFNKLKKEPAYNLARIQLDISSNSDFEWGIDIKKSRATVPVSLEEHITQVAWLAIEKSVEIYNSRGSYNRKNTSNNTSLKYVWEQRKNSSGNYMFYLNKKHPLLLEILTQQEESQGNKLKAYLTLIENYSPAMLSGMLQADRETGILHDIKERDILKVKETIAILKELQYDELEIYEVLAESPEYSYLQQELKQIIKGS